MPSIETFLSECIEKLQAIEWLNHGGCGIAALSIYRALKTRYPDAPDTFLFIGSRGLDDTPAHVVYVWENIVADTASSLQDIDDFLEETPYRSWGPSEYATGDVLIYLLGRVDDWNPTFERDKEIPRIEEMLGIRLDDIPQY